MDLSPPFIGMCNQQHVMDSKVSVYYTRDTDGRKDTPYKAFVAFYRSLQL